MSSRKDFERLYHPDVEESHLDFIKYSDDINRPVKYTDPFEEWGWRKGIPE